MENAMNTLIVIAGVAAGYVLAIYTWPAVRTAVHGAEQELLDVKARVASLEAKVRAVLGSHR
jgi:hypothetical protein